MQNEYFPSEAQIGTKSRFAHTAMFSLYLVTAMGLGGATNEKWKERHIARQQSKGLTRIVLEYVPSKTQISTKSRFNCTTTFCSPGQKEEQERQKTEEQKEEKGYVGDMSHIRAQIVSRCCRKQPTPSEKRYCVHARIY